MTEPQPQLSFTAFVLSLASTAAIHFGDLPDPVSGEQAELNLDGAAGLLTTAVAVILGDADAIAGAADVVKPVSAATSQTYVVRFTAASPCDESDRHSPWSTRSR